MAILVAFVFLAAFAALTAAVVARVSALQQLDDRVMDALTRRRTDRLDGIVAPLSMLATQEPLIVQGLVACTMIAVTIGAGAAIHFVVVAVGSAILNEIAKRAVKRRRPPGPHVIRWFHGLSYPSGDLLTAAAIYSTIAMIASPHLPSASARAVLFAIVPSLLAMLAACRVYVRVHHPSDVVGGILLGMAWAFFVSAWFA